MMNITPQLRPLDPQGHASLLQMTIGLSPTPLGHVFICTSAQGIHSLEFEHPQLTFAQWASHLKTQWANGLWATHHAHAQHLANSLFQANTQPEQPIVLCVQGSPFQLCVWEALMNVPAQETISYSALAQRIGKPKAARAVGSAIAKNPVACLIPCHRVLPKNGAIGQFRWGSEKKAQLLQWERTLTPPAIAPTI